MPKKLDLPIIPVSVKLFEGDKEILAKFYPQVGYNFAVRQLVHRHARRLLERENREGALNVRPNPELDDIDTSPLSGEELGAGDD